ncbi:MAG: peptidyl-prolyl cis-trans isomerase [Deltaproteobacteria bacterium]|nr:peptidyl-prolyl cis-trans isomerase [Deltaproteobacteria bacterium]
MRNLGLVSLVTLVTLCLTGRLGRAADEEAGKGDSTSGPSVTLRVPMLAPEFADLPVAIVNDETVHLKELNEALASSHEDVQERKMAPKINVVDLVNRLVNVRLLLGEARTIGLDQLPEVRELVDAFAKGARRQLLLQELGKGASPDKEEADKIYRDAVKEYKIRSALFGKEEVAQEMEKDVAAGRDFNELVDEVIREGKAKGDQQGNFVNGKDLQPEIAAAVSSLAVGAVSPPIKIGYNRTEGFVVLKLEEVRYPEDPAVREGAERLALTHAREKLIQEQKDKLTKENVTFRKKTIKNLDYEAKAPGFEALLKDKRVLAEIKGGKKITVADLTAALKEKFYHGAGRAVEEKRVNQKKKEVLDALVEKSLLEQIAKNKGIDRSPRFKEMTEEYEKSVLFGAFIQKAVAPDVKITDAEVRAYYDEKTTEFTYPEMVRVRSLAFENAARAQQVLEKLQKGADFNWTRANAEGRLKEGTKGMWTFEGIPLLVKDLPGEVKKAVSGAKAGDVRVCSGPEGYAYVLVVDDTIAPRRQPFDEVRADIREKLFTTKLNAAVEDWAAKLRAASRVEVYVTEGCK